MCTGILHVVAKHPTVLYYHEKESSASSPRIAVWREGHQGRREQQPMMRSRPQLAQDARPSVVDPLGFADEEGNMMEGSTGKRRGKRKCSWPYMKAKWSKNVAKLHPIINNILIRVAVAAAKRPISTIVLATTFAFSMVGAGFFTNFYMEVNEDELWTPQNSRSTLHRKWLETESDFPPDRRAVHVNVDAQGKNILTMEGVRRAFEAIQLVQESIPVEDYQRLCAPECEITSVTRFWNNSLDVFEAQAKTDEDVRRTISQPVYPDGSTVNTLAILGSPAYLDSEAQEMQELVDQTIDTSSALPSFGSSVPLLQSAQILLSKISYDGVEENQKEYAETQESTFIDVLWETSDRWKEKHGSPYRLTFFTGRSFADEFTRSIFGDIPLVVAIFFIMSSFTAILFFKRDPVQSRMMLGVSAVVTIVLSLMSGFGIMFILGIPLTSITQLLPFIMFGIGLDDAFIITGSFYRTDPAEDILDRVEETLNDVGVSIALTTVTSAVAFGLGCLSSIPAVYWLCLYAFPTILIDFFFQVSVFIAFVVLDERRVAARRRDLFPCCVVRDNKASTGIEHKQSMGEQTHSPTSSTSSSPSSEGVEIMPDDERRLAHVRQASFSESVSGNTESSKKSSQAEEEIRGVAATCEPDNFCDEQESQMEFLPGNLRSPQQSASKDNVSRRLGALAALDETASVSSAPCSVPKDHGDTRYLLNVSFGSSRRRCSFPSDEGSFSVDSLSGIMSPGSPSRKVHRGTNVEKGLDGSLPQETEARGCHRGSGAKATSIDFTGSVTTSHVAVSTMHALARGDPWIGSKTGSSDSAVSSESGGSVKDLKENPPAGVYQDDISQQSRTSHSTAHSPCANPMSACFNGLDPTFEELWMEEVQPDLLVTTNSKEELLERELSRKDYAPRSYSPPISYKHPSEAESSGEPKETPVISVDDAVPEPAQLSLSDRFMTWYANKLVQPRVRLVVIIVAAALAGVFGYSTSQLTQFFDLAEVLPDDSYIPPYLDSFDSYTTQGTYLMQVTFRFVDQSLPNMQDQMIDFVEDVVALKQVPNPPRFFWLRDFTDFINQTPGLVSQSFQEQINSFLAHPLYGDLYKKDMAINSAGNLTASRAWTYLSNVDPDDVRDQINTLHDQRAVSASQPVNNGEDEWPFFSYAKQYPIWEFYAVAVDELIFTTVVGVASVTGLGLFFIPHWSAAFFIFPIMVVLYIDLLGFIQFCGVHINAVSYVTCAMSIGLLVDFVLHVLFRYFELAGDRVSRTKEMLRTMGSSVMVGGLTTFIGVLPVAFASSPIFFTVFVTFFGMVLLGLTHGLIVLPALLATFGPEDDVPIRKTRRAKELRSSFAADIFGLLRRSSQMMWSRRFSGYNGKTMQEIVAEMDLEGCLSDDEDDDHVSMDSRARSEDYRRVGRRASF